MLIALSIAVVSVLGAIVAWRAEVHAGRASRYEQDAVAASITAAQSRSEAEAAAGKAYSQFAHYQRLGNEANEITPNACSLTDRTNIIDLDAGVVCSTQVQFSGYNSTGYVDPKGHFDLEKYARPFRPATQRRTTSSLRAMKIRPNSNATTRTTCSTCRCSW